MENKKQSTKIHCNFCGYEWITASKMMMVSCPSCLKKIPNSNYIEPKHVQDNNSQTVPGDVQHQEVAHTGSSHTLKPLSKQEDQTSC